MKTRMQTLACTLAVFAACLPAAAAAAENDPRDLLRSGEIESVRITLPPRGAGIGFEKTLPGDESLVEDLAGVILRSEPGGGHKCPNAGTIRFRMEDGSVVGAGLLPGHEPGLYAVRIYDGDEFVATYRVDRDALLAVLGGMGVPMDDPAFRE